MAGRNPFLSFLRRKGSAEQLNGELEGSFLDKLMGLDNWIILFPMADNYPEVGIGFQQKLWKLIMKTHHTHDTCHSLEYFLSTDTIITKHFNVA